MSVLEVSTSVYFEQVVMARRTRLDIGTTFDPLTLLATLQVRLAFG